MRRVVFAFALFCATLAVVFFGLWGRSYRVSDYPILSAGDWVTIAAFSQSGVVRFSCRDGGSEGYYAQWTTSDIAPGETAFHTPFSFDSNRAEPSRLSTYYGMSLPHWFVAVVFGATALVLFHLRRGRRFGSGACPHCGYDLRATPDRCPECGYSPIKPVRRDRACPPLVDDRPETLQ